MRQVNPSIATALYQLGALPVGDRDEGEHVLSLWTIPPRDREIPVLLCLDIVTGTSTSALTLEVGRIRRAMVLLQVYEDGALIFGTGLAHLEIVVRIEDNRPAIVSREIVRYDMAETESMRVSYLNVAWFDPDEWAAANNREVIHQPGTDALVLEHRDDVAIADVIEPSPTVPKKGHRAARVPAKGS